MYIYRWSFFQKLEVATQRRQLGGWCDPCSAMKFLWNTTGQARSAGREMVKSSWLLANWACALLSLVSELVLKVTFLSSLLPTGCWTKLNSHLLSQDTRHIHVVIMWKWKSRQRCVYPFDNKLDCTFTMFFFLSNVLVYY